MEPFPCPKANECGTSPDCAVKTGRKDAHPGGFLVHANIYSEAWREALLLVQLPSQMGKVISQRGPYADRLGFFPPNVNVFKVDLGSPNFKVS